MRADDPTTLPNPFAVEPIVRRRARGPFAAAVKVLLGIVVAFAIVITVGSESRRWLFHRLTSDFETLQVQQKRDRLAQIAELDEIAIPFLVDQVAADEIGVARTAHDLLKRMQDGWTTLPRSTMIDRQKSLILALDGHTIRLPDDRTGWANGLAQDAMMEAVSGDDESSRELHRLASDVVSKLALTERPGPSILDTSPGGFESPVRVSGRLTPLPIDLTGSDRSEGLSGEISPGWHRESRVDTESASPSQGQPGRAAAVSDPNHPAASIYQSAASGGPTIRLRPLDSDDPRQRSGVDNSRIPTAPIPAADSRETEDAWEVGLRRAAETRAAETQAATEIGTATDGAAAHGDSLPRDDEDGSVRSAVHLVRSPMETLDDRSVIHWLGSRDPRRRGEARDELRRRGLDDDEIDIAAAVASPDLRTRLEVIDVITRSDRLDPRPWLLMLLEDPNRDIKLRVISALATMSDPGIASRLKARVAEEPDPTVAARIRHVLSLR